MSIANKSVAEREHDESPVAGVDDPARRLAPEAGAPPRSQNASAATLVPPRDAGAQAPAAYTLLLEALARLAQDSGTAPDLVTVSRALVQFACASCPANGLYVSRYDPERQEMRCVYAWNAGLEQDHSALLPLPAG